MTVGDTVREVKSIYTGVNGEAVKIWDKEEGVLNKELYEQYLKYSVQYQGTLEQLVPLLKEREANIVKEEESLWQKLLKKLKK